MTRKRNQKGRNSGGPAFVQLFNYMLASEAWRSLKPQARAVYLAIAGRYKGANNGYLAASVRDLASECLIDAKTVTASLNGLIARGFIERTQEGSFACKVRLAAEYRLTVFACDRTGDKPSKAFMKWQPNNS
jgi:hypothetical protein